MNAERDSPSLLEQSTRIVLRPLGNPLPLGFLALAGGTFVVSGLQLGWVDAAEVANVALVLIAFVAPLQLLAAVLSYLARDVVAGTGMGILAGTWLSVGAVLFRSAPGATSDVLGLLLIVAGAAMCVSATGALTGKLVPAAVLFTAGSMVSAWSSGPVAALVPHEAAAGPTPDEEENRCMTPHHAGW